MATTIQVAARGTVVIPKQLRLLFGIEEGSLLILEQTEQGILLRPARAVPVEVYTPEKKARMLLEDAVDAEGYAAARRFVTHMGLDPDAVDHERPDFAPDSPRLP
ncbi:MAG: AbrB/MazE/SpoVT family DNA-binding domain-containing protein [Phycisphaerales bacterium]|nr:AbrB/MazE/SpoVT family DNA-binding domain-containing protein [Phycisphaerales bacterium]